MSPAYLAELNRSYLPEPQASLLNGIVLGIPLKNQWWLYQDLIKVGLVHLIVLSGMNITLLIRIVSSVVFFLPKTMRILALISTIVLFILFIGVQPPLIRAGIMGICTLVGLLAGRKVKAWYSLILTAILSLVLWPEWVSSLSFYLSYAATSGLILVPKPLSMSNYRKKKVILLINYCLEDLQTSLAAQMFTAPLIWYYFGRISFISPITNLLVSWTIAPLMVLGIAMSFLGSIYHDLGKPFAFCAYILLSYILFVVHLFA